MRSTSTADPVTEASVRPHIVRGSIWMIAMRWAIRSIGIVSTIIQARLLTPTDFGVVTMAMLFVGIVEVLGQTGQQAALIRHPDPEREHFDTAWTIQVLSGLVLGVAVFVGAEFAGGYFGDSRTVPLIQVLSLRVFIGGFENIGTVLFRKELDFAMEFRFGVYQKLLAFVTTLGLAFYLRNYWALVGGILGGQILTIGISYLLHPYRPRICFARMKELWHFSFWSWVMTIGGFIYNRIDQYVISAFGSSGLMGLYQLSTELAKMPSDELVRPLARALLPAYSKLNQNVNELKKSYLNVLSAVVLISISSGVGIALVADDLVLVLLGEQWTDAAYFVVWLALASAITACSHSVFLILSTMNRQRRAAVQAWWRLLLMLPILGISVKIYGVRGIAPAYLVGVILLAPTYFLMLRPIFVVTISELYALSWRPLAAAAVMAITFLVIPGTAWAELPVVRLMIKVAAGAATFSTMLVLLWWISKKPSGIEKMLIGCVQRYFHRLQAK